jgi:hypothetical protein
MADARGVGGKPTEVMMICHGVSVINEIGDPVLTSQGHALAKMLIAHTLGAEGDFVVECSTQTNTVQSAPVHAEQRADLLGRIPVLVGSTISAESVKDFQQRVASHIERWRKSPHDSFHVTAGSSFITEVLNIALGVSRNRFEIRPSSVSKIVIHDTGAIDVRYTGSAYSLPGASKTPKERSPSS